MIIKADVSLPTFTFRQVGARSIEFQALPGPEVRALRAKIMRHASFLGPGGQPKYGMWNRKRKDSKFNSEFRNGLFHFTHVHSAHFQMRTGGFCESI